MNFAGVSGQEMVQNLETNTYWTPNNPKRPISPDFFYNSNGFDKDELADKISNQVKTDMDTKNNQKEMLDQIKALKHSNGTPDVNVKGLTLTHLVILGSSLFIGYMIYQNLNK